MPATRAQLVARWRDDPWQSVESRILEMAIVTAEEQTAARLDYYATSGSNRVPEGVLPRLDMDEIFGLLEGIPFRNEVPSGRDLRGSYFPGALEVDLSNVDFSHCRDMGTLLGCDLTDARLDGLRRAPYQLQGDRFLRTSFRGANLRHTWMTCSRYERCVFDGANLEGAHANDTCFKESSFRRARLAGIDLRGADLRGCDFSWADLTGALLSGARIDASTRLKDAVLTGAYTGVSSTPMGATYEAIELSGSLADMRVALERKQAR